MSPASGGRRPALGGQIRPNQDGCGFSPTLLITGFGPFPGVKLNPSERLATRIAGAPGWNRLGWRAEALIFPTGYALVSSLIDTKAAERPAPALVVMLGVAARERALRVELRAKNRVSTTHRDASHAKPRGTCLAPGAETMRLGRSPALPALRALRLAGVPARLSRDAGRYVCNAAYWRMLGAMPKTTEMLFLHIPLPAKAGTRKADPRPDMAAMTRAITALVRAMIGRARLRR
jgi:pyroglutamyl-peptidase